MLKLMILNGDLQGSEFNLYEGLTIGAREGCDIHLKSSKAFKNTLTVSCDPSGGFVLTSKSKSACISVGEICTLNLIFCRGLFFLLVDVGFSTQEGEAAQKPKNKYSFAPSTYLTHNEDIKLSIYPLSTPILFEFVRGTLLNTSIEIHWHPYSIGAMSNLHHFIDEHINFEDDILALEKSTEANNQQTLIRPFISNFISINKQLISKPTIVQNGDLVEFSDTAFYIRIK